MLEQLHASALKPSVLTSEPTAIVPPQNGSSEPLEPSSNSMKECAPAVPASRGIHQGGRPRVYASWFRSIARTMADGTSFQKAAAMHGLVFSRKEEKRIRQMKEFRKLRFAFQRLYESQLWGHPSEAEALDKLLLLEEGRPHRTPPKPRGAKYISHPFDKRKQNEN